MSESDGVGDAASSLGLDAGRASALSLRRKFRIIYLVLCVPPVAEFCLLALLGFTLSPNFLGVAVAAAITSSITTIGFLCLGIYKLHIRRVAVRVIFLLLLFLFMSAALASRLSSLLDIMLFSALTRFLTFSLMLAVLIGRGKAVQRAFASAAYLEVDRSRFRGLWSMLDEITRDAHDRFLLPQPSIKVLLDRRGGGFLPFIACAGPASDKVTSDLVVPRPFFSYCERYPELARCVFAHELGHIYQNDADIWPQVDLFYTACFRFFFPIMIFSLWLSLASLASTDVFDQLRAAVEIIPQVISIILLWGGNADTRSARRTSEFMSDRLAMLLTSEAVARTCISTFASKHSVLHPSLTERLERLGQEELDDAAAEALLWRLRVHGHT